MNNNTAALMGSIPMLEACTLGGRTRAVILLLPKRNPGEYLQSAP